MVDYLRKTTECFKDLKTKAYLTRITKYGKLSVINLLFYEIVANSKRLEAIKMKKSTNCIQCWSTPEFAYLEESCISTSKTSQ